MTAYEAMSTLLDINETIEALKSRNTANAPDLELCKAVELLEGYRHLLALEMMETSLKVFKEVLD